MGCILALSRWMGGRVIRPDTNKRKTVMTIRSIPAFAHAFDTDTVIAIAFVSLSLLVAGATAIVGA